MSGEICGPSGVWSYLHTHPKQSFCGSLDIWGNQGCAPEPGLLSDGRGIENTHARCWVFISNSTQPGRHTQTHQGWLPPLCLPQPVLGRVSFLILFLSVEHKSYRQSEHLIVSSCFMTHHRAAEDCWDGRARASVPPGGKHGLRNWGPVGSQASKSNFISPSYVRVPQEMPAPRNQHRGQPADASQRHPRQKSCAPGLREGIALSCLQKKLEEPRSSDRGWLGLGPDSLEWVW